MSQEDELLNELAECDDTVYDVSDYEKVKKINEVCPKIENIEIKWDYK